MKVFVELECKVDGKWFKSRIHLPRGKTMVFRRAEVTWRESALSLGYYTETCENTKYFYPSRNGIKKGKYELSNKAIKLLCCLLANRYKGLFWKQFFDNVASYVIGDRLLEKNWSNMSPNVDFFKIGLTDEGRLWCNRPSKGNVISGTEADFKTKTIVLYGDVQRFQGWIRDSDYEPFEFRAVVTIK